MLEDELWAGPGGPAGLRTEEAHPLKEVPHPGGTEEEGDQTKEADWHPEQLVSMMEVSPWRAQRGTGFQRGAAVLEGLSCTGLQRWGTAARSPVLRGECGRGPR